MQTFGLRAALRRFDSDMAIYHLSVKTISRSAGRSATAAAAYRAGVRIVDERTGEIHDYRRRAGVVHTEVFAPADAPAWVADRGALWNAAEQSERRKNSTVAREVVVALPTELDQAERLELARDLARDLVQRHGVAVDLAIHEPGRDGDDRNHHAHLLLTTRRVTDQGLSEKTRELDAQATGPALVIVWRERWAALTNAALERAGRAERIDHRSHQARGVDDAPSVHLGPTATAIERRGEVSRIRQDAQRARAEHKARARAVEQAAAELAAAREQLQHVQRAAQDHAARLESRGLLDEYSKAIQLKLKAQERRASAEVRTQRLKAYLSALEIRASGSPARLDTWRAVFNLWRKSAALKTQIQEAQAVMTAAALAVRQAEAGRAALYPQVQPHLVQSPQEAPKRPQEAPQQQRQQAQQREADDDQERDQERPREAPRP